MLQLKPRDFEYLDITQEECAEVIQIISKIKRFGLYSHNPMDQSKTNQDLLIEEVGDVLGLIQTLVERGLFTMDQIELRAQYKKEKLTRYVRTED